MKISYFNFLYKKLLPTIGALLLLSQFSLGAISCEEVVISSQAQEKFVHFNPIEKDAQKLHNDWVNWVEFAQSYSPKYPSHPYDVKLPFLKQTLVRLKDEIRRWKAKFSQQKSHLDEKDLEVFKKVIEIYKPQMSRSMLTSNLQAMNEFENRRDEYVLGKGRSTEEKALNWLGYHYAFYFDSHMNLSSNKSNFKIAALAKALALKAQSEIRVKNPVLLLFEVLEKLCEQLDPEAPEYGSFMVIASYFSRAVTDAQLGGFRAPILLFEIGENYINGNLGRILERFPYQLLVPTFSQASPTQISRAGLTGLTFVRLETKPVDTHGLISIPEFDLNHDYFHADSHFSAMTQNILFQIDSKSISSAKSVSPHELPYFDNLMLHSGKGLEMKIPKAAFWTNYRQFLQSNLPQYLEFLNRIDSIEDTRERQLTHIVWYVLLFELNYSYRDVILEKRNFKSRNISDPDFELANKYFRAVNDVIEFSFIGNPNSFHLEADPNPQFGISYSEDYRRKFILSSESAFSLHEALVRVFEILPEQWVSP